MLDSKGLVVDAQDEYRRDLAWTGELAAAHGLRAGSSLLDVVRAAKPTVLVGVSGVPGLFGEEVVRDDGRLRSSGPPSSRSRTPRARPRRGRPTSWPGPSGRALMATGSPFEPVDVGGRQVRIGQGNNAFVFPGVGLGVLVSEAREVTDGMFAAAADALAAQLPEEDLRRGQPLPARRRAARASPRRWPRRWCGRPRATASPATRPRTRPRPSPPPCGTRPTRRSTCV